MVHLSRDIIFYYRKRSFVFRNRHWSVVKVILVGVALGWITGLNKSSDVDEAADLVKW